MKTDRDYSKSWFAENKITPGLTVCTHNITDYIGQVKPYAPDGGPLNARGKNSGCAGKNCRAESMFFNTGLCRLCDASLQMDVGKSARGITASNMSPTQRKMQLVKQWPRRIGCRWSITNTHKINRIRMPLLKLLWASNSQSPMPLHLQKHLGFSSQAKRGRPTNLRPCGCQHITLETLQSFRHISDLSTTRQ